MTNLSIFDTQSAAELGAKMELKHPVTGETAYYNDNEKKPITIKLRGTDSGEYEKELQKIARQQKGKKSNDVDIEQAKRQSCEIYAKLTLGWENMPKAEGEGTQEFSKDAAFELYMKFKDIRVQVGNFITEKANFIKS